MNDQQWTGRPMVEQCETHDFFEADKVYRDASKPQMAEALRQQFWCMSTFVHPSTRVLYAVGVFRSAANRPWNPYPVQFVFSNWTTGWDEIQLQDEVA